MRQQNNNTTQLSTSTSTPSMNWPHGPTRFERRFGNNVTRIVVAIIAIPLILGVVFLGGWWFALLVAVMSTGALLEFYWMLEKNDIQPNKWLGVIAGLLLTLTFAHREFSLLCERIFLGSSSGQGVITSSSIFDSWSILAQLGVLILAGIILLSLELARENRQALRNIMGTVTGLFYVSFFMATLLGLHHLAVNAAPVYSMRAGAMSGTAGGELSGTAFGGFLVLVVLVGIWTCDSFAYFGGRAFGKHKLFERVSPKKTWEGAICGAVAAVAACIGLSIAIDGLVWYDGLFIGLVAGVCGQLGDLVESHIKRACDVKDSSQIIPGHGGVLDRFDSLLFVAPLVYFYMLSIYVFFPAH